jgi:molybdate transport system ATP-binding protein
MIRGDISLSRGQFRLHADFALPATGVCAVFGPSGAGKTSFLRAIAGLEPGVAGRLEINGSTWEAEGFRMPVHERRVGFVFQDPSLLPHLSVQGNLDFARKRAEGRAENTREIIELLGISQLLHRTVAGLSGGESQRVALARALLGNPRMLLLDEPLAALDMQARQLLMSFLEKVIQRLDIPVMYVSHSPDEVARLADYLLLMENGEIRACGPLTDLLGDLKSPLTAAEEAFSVLQCTVIAPYLPGLVTVMSAGGQHWHLASAIPEGVEHVRLRVQARDVSLSLVKPDKTSIINVVPARISEISEQLNGYHRTVKLDVAGENLLSRVSDYSCRQLGLAAGMPVFAQIKSVALLY